MVEKVRIKKHQKPKIEQWCEVLEITESRFVEDAITFYLRFLEGKYPSVPTISAASTIIPQKAMPAIKPNPIVPVSDDPEEYDGGLEL